VTPEVGTSCIDIFDGITHMMSAPALLQCVPQMTLRAVWRYKLQIDSVTGQFQELHQCALRWIVDNFGFASVPKSKRVLLCRPGNVFDQYSYVVQSQIAPAYETATFLLFI
jgi:hypothetical protein